MTGVPQPGVRTTCPYCGVGCGIKARREADGTVKISGDEDHPANSGRLCSKGSALGETTSLDGRLIFPEIGGQRAGWGEALDLVAQKFSETIQLHGPDSVAFYVSGQILSEDYYVANKLMKGFIGSANIDTNSRLCMASSVAGHRRAFGSDTVPGIYEDLELADLIVLVGSNLAWCHPVLYQRIAAAKEKRPHMRVVLIDPRRTMSADIADMHLAIAPDGDVALFNGLLTHLDKWGVIDETYIDSFTNGFSAALRAAQELEIEGICAETGLGADGICAFYDLFARTEKVVTVFSQGVNQSTTGTDKVNAIINCHLATGRIGKPGTGPFSVTGQPNAMGGREVGGLANMLAAHMEIGNPDHRRIVQRFWQAPRIAHREGLKAVEMFRAVADGRIKAIWIMATNPVDSMPEADAVKAALGSCPFVVVSDVVAQNDTQAVAHVKLPSLAWGEKSGTVTNSERRISRQRAFLPHPGEAMPDWWQICQIARRMGYGSAFDYPNAAAIFREFAALTDVENDGSRDFDIGSFAEIGEAEYEDLDPFLWPRRRGVEDTDRPRFFSGGGFFTPDGKARFVAINGRRENRTGPEFPFVLNTGRVRDHWHTMTRTGKSERLSAHIGEPYCEIHPADAAAVSIRDADLVRVSNMRAEVVVRALVTDRQQPGSVFVPMHWTDQVASSARIDALVEALTDPYSGQPGLKNTAVAVSPFDARTFGFAVCMHPPQTDQLDYWVKARTAGGWRLEFATSSVIDDAEKLFRRISHLADEASLSLFEDKPRGLMRFAAFDGPRLIAAMYLAPSPVQLSRVWVCEQLTMSHDNPGSRWQIMPGRPSADMPDKGAIICSCMGVGYNDITTALRAGYHSVDAIGKRTLAGTNCGSCKSEIREIINANLAVAAE